MSQSISNSNVDEVDKMDESFSSYCSSIVSQDDSYSKYIIEFEKNKILTLEDDGTVTFQTTTVSSSYQIQIPASTTNIRLFSTPAGVESFVSFTGVSGTSVVRNSVSGLTFSSATIYNSDGVLFSNRIVGLNNNTPNASEQDQSKKIRTSFDHSYSLSLCFFIEEML